MKKLPLVKVYWQDTCSDSRWADMDEACKERGIPCCSIGWLLRNDKREVVITPMKRTDMRRCNDVQIIPKGCVTAVRKV